MQRSLLLFQESIKSKHIKRKYKSDLDQFLSFTQIKDYDRLTKISPDQLQTLLEDYLLSIKKRLSPNSVPSKFMGVKHFFVMNRVFLNWDIIWKMCPEKVKTHDYRPWTTQEIQKMLEMQDTLRNKAFIHFQASTGARIGVHDYELTLSELSNVSDDCLAVKLYANEKEEYWAFLTQEASKALTDYHGERRKAGECFDKKTPLFRTNYRLGIEKVKQLKAEGARALMNRIIEKSGVTREKIKGQYDVQADHGFRKRFNTILKLQNGLNSNVAEKILGHKNGLDGVYLKPTLEQCFIEFSKAIKELTIDPTERQKYEIEEKSKKINELETKERQNKLQQAEIEQQKALLAQMQDRLEQIEKQRQIDSLDEQIRIKTIKIDTGHDILARPYASPETTAAIREIVQNLMSEVSYLRVQMGAIRATRIIIQ